MPVTVHQGSLKVDLVLTYDYDLTGVGTITINFGRGNDTFAGGGATVVNAAGVGASTVTYTSSATNVDFAVVGEQRLQLVATWADGRKYYSSWGEIDVEPSFGVT